MILSNADKRECAVNFQAFKFSHTLRVRWSECDLQAIAYYATYLTWAEIGFAEYCRNLGFSLYKLSGLNRFDTVTAKLVIEFKSSARLDDLIDIHVRLANIGRASLNFEFLLFRSIDTQVLASIEATYVSYDNQKHESKPVPEEVRKIFTHFETTGEVRSTQGIAFFAEVNSSGSGY